MRGDDIEITHEWRFEESLFAAYYRVCWLQVRMEQNDLYGIFELISATCHFVVKEAANEEPPYFLCLWVRASCIKFNNCPTIWTVFS